MTKTYMALAFLFVGICYLFQRCGSRNEKDPQALADSLLNESNKLFEVEIDVNYYSPTSLTIRDKIEDRQGAIFSDSTSLFVNGHRMQYSVSVGNYERYPHYSYEFENKKIPQDTLRFTAQLSDSSNYTIGYVSISSITELVNDIQLRTDIPHDKKQTLVIRGGKNLADSLVIYRLCYEVTDGVGTFISGPNDPSTISQHWNANQPVKLSPDYFQDDQLTVYGLHLTWMKDVRHDYQRINWWWKFRGARSLIFVLK